MTDNIPVAGPWITQLEIDYTADAAATAWGTNHYAYNSRFEQALARHVGVEYAVSLPHCTAAIHLSLAALGVGPGDEVIVPEITWIASVAPVIYVGADLVYADIDPDTWCIDPASVESCITPRTKAVIGVDLYGSMVDWPSLRSITSARNIHLIEDAAEALGSKMDGRQAGSFGDTGVFSFHGSKTVVTGEGGMLVTNDSKIHARVMTLRDHGRAPGDKLFLNNEVGFKYKMSALQAAMGLAQMERIDELIEKKRQIYRLYADRLGQRKDLVLNAEPENVENSYWMVTAVLNPETGINKFELIEKLAAKGIDTRPFFSPLSTLPALANHPEATRFLPAIPRGHSVAEFGVNLPSGYAMEEELVDRVATAVIDILDDTAG